jgi:biotin synthase
VADILDRALGGADPNPGEIEALLSASDHIDEKAVLAAGDAVRKRTVGDDILLRGIIDFSSVCVRGCFYCGIRGPNRSAKRYRMTPDEILGSADRIRSAGISTVVLQAGEDPLVTADYLCRIVRRIKETIGLKVTLSVGERPHQDYRAFREAGADRYLLKHETAVPGLYKTLHPDMRLEDRIRCLKWIAALDYEVGSGNIIGLPGQGVRDIAADIVFMRRLGVHMIAIGPLIPHAETPLAKCRAGDIGLVLRSLAVARIAMPEANMPATTATGTIDRRGIERALCAGANVVMVDFTPEHYRDGYSIYPGRITRDANAFSAVERIRTIGASLGRGIA